MNFEPPSFFLINRKIKFPAIFMAVTLAIIACNLPRQSKPDTQATMNAALTEVSAAAAYPTNTVEISNPNQQSPTTTSTPTPTETSGTKTLPGPTAASIDADVFAQDLLSRDHELLASSSTIGPKDFVYSAYLFRNNRIDPIVDETRTDICRLAIYRLDDGENELLRSFTGPLYAPNNRYTYPVYCEAINWDSPSQKIVEGGKITQETRTLLGFNGYWSDINQNGLPEFAVFYQYCAQGCLNFGAVAVHFYEIKNTYQLVDITADLPGVIQPWKLVHRSEPLDLWVYDNALEYMPLIYIESYWIYAWDETKFTNVSSKYQSEYAAQIDQIASGIRDKYGLALTEPNFEMLQILVLSNKANLSQSQTLATFMDLSNPNHWPGTNATQTCWLQLARAYAQRNAAKGQSFSMPPNENELYKANLEEILDEFEQYNYDLSACKSLP